MGKQKKKQQSEDETALAGNPAVVETVDEGGENDEESRGGGKKKPEKKDDDGSITVVLKVDMHCEGCSKKVIKSVRGTQGVEAVKADAGIGKLTVVGKLDPWKLRDQVEAKCHKKVDLVSPANFPRKSNDPKKPFAAKQTDEKNKPQEKLVVTTVTLKIRLHCEGCIRRIRKTILKIKGVDGVVFDTQTDQVTVKGTMDAKPLPEKLKSKLKRDVAVVQPKKDKGAGGGDGEKKNKDGGEEKKKGGKGGGGGGAGGGGEKEEIWNPAAPAGYAMEYGHRPDMVHAPQLFSDENPNSCSVM